MRLAIRNLLRRPVRSALAVLGVGVGVGSIVAFTAIGEGFKQSINEYARNTGAHLLVIELGAGDPAFGHVSPKLFDSIRRHPNVEAVAHSSFYPLKIPGRKSPLVVIGRLPDERLIQAYKNPALKGRLLRSEGEVMLGYIAARELGKTLGDTIEIFGKPRVVVGIYRTGVRWENGGAVVHHEAMRKARKMEKGSANGAFVYLKDPAKEVQTLQQLQLAMPHMRVLSTSLLASSFDQLAYLDWFIWVISLAALIVGGIGVLNTMLMSVSERVREIGTLRAFGWSRARVLLLILQEGLVCSLIGGFLGFAFGFFGAEVLLRLVPGGALQASHSIGTFSKALAVAVVLGFLGALYPAWRASRLDPAEALRYE